MQNPIENINKVFESRVRLGIMSVLLVNDEVDFNSLKTLLELTDGNLASHLKALEKNEMIEVAKQFIDRKPNTTYSVSEKGRAAFQKHLTALEQLINK
ncbi:winged helix-turn-helix domain-containing protein [Roseimarinus sediminis]|uniref:winged helix-turn-helix domain-containing protein n=1 Tax=Roseimarinus sediminis TaxID=1610899 RepID=UPI003D1A0577